MIRRVFISLVLICSAIVLSPLVVAQTQTPAPPRGVQPPAEVPRAVRRDVPMTNAIRRAFDAGTRDWTGKPGPNYWQLQTDYTINVSLDPATQTLTGTETIKLQNNSPQPLTDVYLRLDHNNFRGLAP